MAWTAPITFLPKTVLTAAQLNLMIRDNLNEMAPAKASTPGSIFVTSGRHSIVEQVPQFDTVLDTNTTDSQEYVDLDDTGPDVKCHVSWAAMVNISAQVRNTVANQHCLVSFALLTPSGERGVEDTEVTRPTDERSLVFKTAVVNQDFQGGFTTLIDVPEPGTYIIRCKYRVTGGTGTFYKRRLAVIPF